ncbi:esterase yheT [Yersinia ruckeri ATCC 29473]|nr:esterase yheT [Yersinia ruckeri ATCC 29473]
MHEVNREHRGCRNCLPIHETAQREVYPEQKPDFHSKRDRQNPHPAAPVFASRVEGAPYGEPDAVIGSANVGYLPRRGGEKSHTYSEYKSCNCSCMINITLLASLIYRIYSKGKRHPRYGAEFISFNVGISLGCRNHAGSE